MLHRMTVTHILPSTASLVVKGCSAGKSQLTRKWFHTVHMPHTTYTSGVDIGRENVR